MMSVGESGRCILESPTNIVIQRKENENKIAIIRKKIDCQNSPYYRK